MAIKKGDLKRLGNFFLLNRKGTSEETTEKLRKTKKKKQPEKSSEEKHNGPGQGFENKSRSKNINKDVPSFLIEPSLQFPGTEESPKVDLVIGFDLGTAWTKIVIQDTSIGKATAVSFREYGSRENSYLLPTRVGIKNGLLTLCKRDDPNHLCTDLKISLMERPQVSMNKTVAGDRLTTTGSEMAAVFVALVLRYARRMIIQKQRDIYRNNFLRWQLNLGIPVKNYDEEETKEVFHHVALAGWWLSAQRGEITLQSSKEVMKKVQDLKFDPGINREHINVVPEVAAEVAGYAYSDLREKGLHLLVDIGATTLDVSTFLLNEKDGEHRYGFLAAEIGRYGAFELHRARLVSFRNFIISWLSEVDGISETLEPVPESCDHFLPSKKDIPDFDDEFIKSATLPITRVIARTKRDRDPKSKAWKEGLPLFVCGGGSLAKFYTDKLFYNVKTFLNTLDWKGFREKEVPKPENLDAEGLRSHEYHRLAVAYGLSFQYENIGFIVPPKEIEDIPREIHKDKHDGKYIDKDQT